MVAGCTFFKGLLHVGLWFPVFSQYFIPLPSLYLLDAVISLAVCTEYNSAASILRQKRRANIPLPLQFSYSHRFFFSIQPSQTCKNALSHPFPSTLSGWD
ncbi:hypothetical protein EDD21DRAFT_392716 [Dissophora ornata]|nr:hypothetical protein EDD21DRAFT_392716 [Dissophora ornata]